MGSCTPEPGGHPGKSTPGGKGGNPTPCDQNSVTRNVTGTSGTTRLEKPDPTDQHQCPIGPLTTSVGKPAASKPVTKAPTTETPGGTHDVGNEAAIRVTQMPHIPEATSTRARSRTGRKPPLDATGIVRGTPLRPAIRTAPTAFQAPLLPFAT